MPVITWSKVKSSINDDITKERIKLVQNDQDSSYSLVIEKLLPTDTGSFQLKAKNPLGEVTSTCVLTVNTFPFFKKELTTTAKDVIKSQVEKDEDIITKFLVNEKSTLKIECQLDGLPKPTAKWFFGDSEITSSDRFKLESKQDNYYLTIKDLNLNAKGLYRCEGTNNVGKTTSNIIIDLNTIPVVSKPLENTEIVLESDNQQTELVCVFTSKPKADITWYFSNKEIKDGDSNSGSTYFTSEESTTDSDGNETTTARLKLQNLALANSGSFKCKSKNCAGEANTACVLSIIKAPVILQPLPQSINLTEKEQILMEVKVGDSVPKAIVQWFKDDIEIKTSKRVIIAKPVIESTTNSAIYTLTIQEASAADLGVYKLRASNSIATVETLCTVDVLSPPKIVKDLKPKMECTEGDKISLDVTATGNPHPEFKWLCFNHEKNIEEEVHTSEGHIEIRCLPSSNIYSLIFHSIKKTDIGKYILKLKNIAGEAEASIDMTVNYLPVLSKNLEDQTVTEGSECLFLVVGEGQPKPTVEWFKNDAKLKTDKRMLTSVEENSYRLAINETKNADKGQYKAVLKNKCGQVETFVANLNISFGPAILKSMKDVEVVEGSVLEMTCDVSGTPKPEFAWFKDQVKLEQDDKFSFVVNNDTYTLRIGVAEEKDTGLYRCVLKNEFGSSETKSNANVLIKPRFSRELKAEYTGSLSKTVEFIGVLVARPDAKLKFIKDNRELLIKDRFKVTTTKLNENETEIILAVSDLQANDAGVYKIEGTNKSGSGLTEAHLVVKGEPVFTRVPVDVTVAEKKSVKFDCEVIGLPQPTVEWYKDGVLIERSETVSIEVRKTLNTLQIKDLTRKNSGRYVMKAKNESGEAEAAVILNVDMAPFIITSLPEKIEVRQATSACLQCEVGGAPVPTVTWSKKGVDLEFSKENRLEMITEGLNNILMVDNAQASDAGIYNILAQNRIGKVSSKTELVVLIEPKFIRKIKDTQVIEKKITKLEAEIIGVPKPEVTWFKNGVQISVDDDRIQTHDAKGGVFQLIIKNSQNEDTGIYECRATSDIGQAVCKAQLEIETKPEFLKKLEVLHAVESCPAEWHFQVTGIPKPVIEFTRGGQEISLDESSEYQIEALEDNNYVLHFKSVVHADIGTWTCTAHNSAGKVSCVAKLESLPLSAPKFIKELCNKRLGQNIDNRLEVQVTGVPFPSIEWFKDDKLIDLEGQQDKYATERDMKTSHLYLIVKNSQIEVDSGVYKAKISNPGGEATCEGYYTVKGYAPIFVERPDKVYAIKDQTATFAAVIDADPLANVTWAKGRNELHDSENIKIFYDEKIDVHFMEIMNCKQKDAGTYQVTATNEFGCDTAPVTLMFTHNPEEVVDYKLNLQHRTPKRSSSQSSEPDWGTLKKAGSRRGSDEEGPDGFKLKHWEREKEETPDKVKITREEKERDPYNYKDIGPRDMDLEKYVKSPTEEMELDGVDKDSDSKKLPEKPQVIPDDVSYYCVDYF